MATAIKVVNSLKAQDIANTDGAMKPNISTENLTDSKRKTIEDCKANAPRDNIVIKLNSNAATKSSEKCKVHEKETQLDPPLNSEIGGNTEVRFFEMTTNSFKQKFKQNLFLSIRNVYFMFIFI